MIRTILYRIPNLVGRRYDSFAETGVGEEVLAQQVDLLRVRGGIEFFERRANPAEIEAQPCDLAFCQLKVG
jgi:hypothetical protein